MYSFNLKRLHSLDLSLCGRGIFDMSHVVDLLRMSKIWNTEICGSIMRVLKSEFAVLFDSHSSGAFLKPVRVLLVFQECCVETQMSTTLSYIKNSCSLKK